MGQMEHRPKSKRINPDPLAKRLNQLCLNQVTQLIMETRLLRVDCHNQVTQCQKSRYLACILPHFLHQCLSNHFSFFAFECMFPNFLFQMMRLA